MPSFIHVPVDPLTALLLPRFFPNPALDTPPDDPEAPACYVVLDHPLLRSVYQLAIDHLPFGQPRYRETPKGKVLLALRIPPGLEGHELMKIHLARLGKALDELTRAQTNALVLGLAIYSNPHAAANVFIKMHNLDPGYEDRLVRAATRSYSSQKASLLELAADYVR